jgi:hypothetical protein
LFCSFSFLFVSLFDMYSVRAVLSVCGNVWLNINMLLWNRVNPTFWTTLFTSFIKKWEIRLLKALFFWRSAEERWKLHILIYFVTLCLTSHKWEILATFHSKWWPLLCTCLCGIGQWRLRFCRW